MLKNRLDEALNQIQQDASHEAIHTIIEELLMSLTHSDNLHSTVLNLNR